MMNDKGFDCVGLEVSEEAVARGVTRLKGCSREGINLKHWDDLTSLPLRLTVLTLFMDFSVFTITSIFQISSAKYRGA